MIAECQPTTRLVHTVISKPCLPHPDTASLTQLYSRLEDMTAVFFLLIVADTLSDVFNPTRMYLWPYLACTGASYCTQISNYHLRPPTTTHPCQDHLQSISSSVGIFVMHYSILTLSVGLSITIWYCV